MKKISTFFKIKRQISFLVFTIILILTSSCLSNKKLTYLQDLPITDTLSFIPEKNVDYKLQSSDLLSVRFVTANKDINELLNPYQSSTYQTIQGEQSAYLINYMIDDSGYIELPILKKIKIEGLTILQAKDTIEKRSLKYLNDVQVLIRFWGIKFSLLGEVKNPGVRYAYQNKLPLLEALAYGGDINYNGNRQKIIIIRHLKTGNQTFEVDVTNSKLMSSPSYYIQPNDIIYVEPRKSTLFKQNAQDYTFVLSLLTTSITTVLLIINFTK